MYLAYPADLHAQLVVPRHRHNLGSLKYRPGSLGLDLEPYPGLSGLFVYPKELVRHPEIDTGPSGPHWGEKEHLCLRLSH